MRILVLSRNFPMPLNSGDKIRTYHILRELSKAHKLTLVSIVQENVELEYLGELNQICHEIYPFKLKLSKKISAAKVMFSNYPWEVIAFYKKEVKAKIRELLTSDHFDIVWVNFLSMAVYLDHDLASRSIIILDQHNADQLIWRKYALESDNIAMRRFAGLNLKRIASFQRQLANLLNVVISVSEEDASFMRKQLPADIAVWTVPNGVDINYFQRSNANNEAGNIILFCGSMDTHMNVDAVLQFAKKVLPLVREKVPDSEFWVVGRNPIKQIRNLAKQSFIKVTGTVEDVRAYYDKAKIFAAPLRFGGGTKLKILEAMAMKVPVVSSSVGTQGIDVTDGEQVVIRDNIEEFADAVIKLLRDEKERGKFINSGRRLVEDKYSWSGIVETLEPKLLQLMNERGLSKGRDLRK